MLTKVVICKIDNDIYTNAYNADGKLEYCLHDNNGGSLEAIYLSKIISINIKNRLAFINYLDDKIGVINLAAGQKLQAGSKVICQMTWIGDNEKYAKFSAQIKLIGKYVILINEKKHYYSQALTWQNDLKEISDEFKNYGIIFRSAITELKDLSIIKEELNFLIHKQIAVNTLSNSSEATQLVSGIGNYIQLLRDSRLANNCIAIVNDEELFQNLSQYLDLWQISEITLDPEAKINNIFKESNNTVKINNGALVFHKLSGINLIDVNSHNSKLDFYQINYLAIDEIVRHIKLYDLNGIILIDFIKNMSAQQQKNIVDSLITKFNEDWRHIRVLGFTKAGFCEIIRNK